MKYFPGLPGILACLLMSCPVTADAAEDAVPENKDREQTLFFIQRSKNANEVHYAARLTAEGKLDRKQPVVAYWLLLAEDGRRAELNFLQRRKAYGFSIAPAPSGETWLMTLVAYPAREITVRQTPDGVQAEILIAGRRSNLEKLYIAATEGKFLPTVNYIELFGRDLEAGEKTYEKIIPD